MKAKKKYIEDLPEAERGDISYIFNKLPNAWDLRSDWARGVVEKMKDLAIDETNKILQEVKK